MTNVKNDFVLEGQEKYLNGFYPAEQSLIRTLFANGDTVTIDQIIETGQSPSQVVSKLETMEL